MHAIIFDTETTGLSAKDGDRVIEIGAVEMKDLIPTGRTFHQYIHPGDREIHPDALKVHGITMERLANEPRFEAVGQSFKDFCGDAMLVAHNAPFDIGFLDAEYARMGLPACDPELVLDTVQVARKKFPGARVSLDMLCDRFDISRANRVLHGALLDARLLAEVFIELMGGAQVKMGFGDEESDVQRADPRARRKTQHPPQPQRPTPLVYELTPEERAAHDAMRAKIGESAIWNRYLGAVGDA
ncbi:MAG: DNA polymerase III subunit epsilon [Pseudomonadota bacterium]